MAKAVLGGGCFWCIESAFKTLRGIISALPGYAGGSDPSPTYEKICSGKTGHAEVVIIEFDESIISFETVLEVFFTAHDPTQLNRQGNDIGTQYRSCIMPMNEKQKEISTKVISEMNSTFDSPLVTTLEDAVNLTIAEEYHHDYFARNPHNPYCKAVVSPKLTKVRKKFAHLQRQ